MALRVGPRTSVLPSAGPAWRPTFVAVFLLAAQLTPRVPSSRTPPSSVFLPHDGKLYPLAVQGTTPVSVRGHDIRIVELRGWLRAVDPMCNSWDPAWYYLLEPDPAWTDAIGISLGDILKVGNIVALGDSREGVFPYRIASRPLIRIEFWGWPEQRWMRPPPRDWSYQGAPGCPDVHFVFDPLRPIPSGPRLEPGRYVRIVGSFVSDAPHATKATVGVWLAQNFRFTLAPEHLIYAAQKIWSEGGEENPGNPARWTEIHPPDLIEPLPDLAPVETIRGVAVSVPSGVFREETQQLELALSPPRPRPAWAHGVRVRELVLAVSGETAFERAVLASRVVADGDSARITINPRWAGVAKFAAIYRVSWNPGGAVWTVIEPRALREPGP